MNPDFKTFKHLAERHSLVPTFKELPCDTDTPVTLYWKLARDLPYAALLESVEGGERLARYSFIAGAHHIRYECEGAKITVHQGKHKEEITSNDPIGELKKILAGLR